MCITLFACISKGLEVRDMEFQQYFSYTVAARFIGAGNRNTERKPPICRKHNVVSSTPRHERDSNTPL